MAHRASRRRPPLARAALAAAVTASIGAALVGGSAASCSASSEPFGNGACDAYCAKAAKLACVVATELASCTASCVETQARCPQTMSELMRCAANEGAILCDTSSLAAHVVNCGAALTARDRCLATPGAADAGSEAGPLPRGL